MQTEVKWWMEEYGFFGEYYMEGDNSEDGYLIEKKQNLLDRTNTEVDGVTRLLELKGKEKILDCPCGYGRHSIDLLKRGFQVVGADINSIHLGRAKNTAESLNLNYDFRKESMLDLKYQDQFDAIINMFYSFGFFDTDEENFKVLKNFYNALKPGGKFLMHTDVNLPRVLSGQYRVVEDRKLKTNNLLRIIDNYNQDTKRIDGKWIIGNLEKGYSVRVFDREEFEQWCKRAGFREVVSYSDWTKSNYDEQAEDMITVATK